MNGIQNIITIYTAIRISLLLFLWCKRLPDKSPPVTFSPILGKTNARIKKFSDEIMSKLRLKQFHQLNSHDFAWNYVQNSFGSNFVRVWNTSSPMNYFQLDRQHSRKNIMEILRHAACTVQPGIFTILLPFVLISTELH